MKKVRLFIVVFLLHGAGFAFSQNLPLTDFKLFHFGFSLGVNFMDFKVTPSFKNIDGRTYQADVTSLMPGFSVSLISDLRLSNYFNLRFNPALHFGDRTISYISQDTDKIRMNTNVKTAFVTLPIYIKYNAFRIYDYRPYLIAGTGVSFDLFRDKRVPVLLNLFDYFIDFGAGCCIYFPFFKFSPEIRFSIGFNNMLTSFDSKSEEVKNPEHRKYSDSLSKLTTQMVTLVFNFE